MKRYYRVAITATYRDTFVVEAYDEVDARYQAIEYFGEQHPDAEDIDAETVGGWHFHLDEFPKEEQ